MGSKIRGRERLLNCDSCGRRIPRDKAVAYDRVTVYSTELKNDDDVRTIMRRQQHYCPSCAKHRHIYQKKKIQAARQRLRDRFREKKVRGVRGAKKSREDSWASYQPGGSKSGTSSAPMEDSQQEESS